ncbi:MAG: HNH endonuclease [Alphaproteobacteria bacterium]|nr:HNH endonuclease [Alphaproteobacteria bacterium]
MNVKNVKIDKTIPLKELEYSIPTEKKRHAVRYEYEHSFRKDFLEFIANNERDNLKQAGLWDSLIDRTLAKGKTPPGWGVHHKIPIHGGGQNNIENLIFIRFAEHFQIHRYIDCFIEDMSEGDSRFITMPYPEGNVYIPTEKNSDVKPKSHEETDEERKARIERNRREKKKEYRSKTK